MLRRFDMFWGGLSVPRTGSLSVSLGVRCFLVRVGAEGIPSLHGKPGSWTPRAGCVEDDEPRAGSIRV